MALLGEVELHVALGLGAGHGVLDRELAAEGGVDVAQADQLEQALHHRTLERRLDPVGDEVEDRAAFHLQAGPRAMAEYERGGVVRRVGTPPAGPVQVPLAFAGVEPGMTIFEMEAGQGYYSGVVSAGFTYIYRDWFALEQSVYSNFGKAGDNYFNMYRSFPLVSF